MKSVLGCDHAGFNIKDKVREHIESKGYEVVEVGTYSADSCHYPIFAKAACKKILDGECELGILICGTGIGISLAAHADVPFRWNRIYSTTLAPVCQQKIYKKRRIKTFHKNIDKTQNILYNVVQYHRRTTGNGGIHMAKILLAGAARRDITPEVGTLLYGYNPHQVSTSPVG